MSDPADATARRTLAAVARFNEAFNRHAVDDVMAAMTPDCVFESTSPPFGDRHVGAGAVRAAWDQFFASSPDAHFDAEEVIATGDRCLVLWRYSWGGGAIRGVDVLRVRDDLVAEKLAYVKG